MKKATIVIALVILVIGVFLIKPEWMGMGDKTPSLAIVTNEDTMPLVTNVSCNNAQDCVNYVLDLDPTAKDIKATCDKTCTFIMDKMPVEVTK